MYFDAIAVTTVAGVLLVCLLSNISYAQRHAIRMLKGHIAVGKIKVRWLIIALLYAVCRFTYHLQLLGQAAHQRYQADGAESTLGTIRIREKLLRCQRNFWLELFTLTLWVIVFQLSHIVAKQLSLADRNKALLAELTKDAKRQGSYVEPQEELLLKTSPVESIPLEPKKIR